MWQRGAFSVQTSHYSLIEELEGHPNIAGRLSGNGEHAAHRRHLACTGLSHLHAKQGDMS